jgi:hypothetical protein
MTYQIVETRPSASQENDLAAITYFMETFLPARGWTVGTHPTKTNTATYSYWILQRNYTDLFTNNPAKSYLWANYYYTTTQSSFNQYEDSTYTTVPGDLANDSTNVVQLSWTINSGSSQFPWKFWVSSENNKAFLVTRNNRIEFWDYGCDFPQYQTWPENEGPAIDRNATCNWLPQQGSAVTTNLPNSKGNDSYEYPLITVLPGRYENLEGAYFLSPIRLGLGSDSLFPWDQPDVSLYCPSSTDYTTTPPNTKVLDGLMKDIYVVQFNAAGDYYLLTKDNPREHSIALNVGPTIPDLLGE